MRERREQLLKIACFVLGAILIYRVAMVVAHSNPLARVRIPDLPTLAAETNALLEAKGTNAPTTQSVSKLRTNAPAVGPKKANIMSRAAGTNQIRNATNQIASRTNETNRVILTNAVDAMATNPALPTALAGMGGNAMLARGIVKPGSNGIVHIASAAPASNVLMASNLARLISTQALASARSPNSRPDIAMLNAGSFSRGTPARAPDLLPEAKARVFRIYDSEILGPVMRPLPMALLGIAGEQAFLRAPGGQTGMVKEGDTVGEIKLLKIGTNRVLVEEAGQKKELKIFEGYGGESLLPKP